MKKLLLFVTLAVSPCALSLVYAQQSAIPPKATAPSKLTTTQSIETKILVGKIESVTVADIAKGIKSEIVAVKEDGQKYTFLVKTTTTIYDADWKAVTLDKLSKNENVKIKYTTTKEGVNEAISISVVK